MRTTKNCLLQFFFLVLVLVHWITYIYKYILYTILFHESGSEVVISMGIRILVSDRRSLSRQIWRKESDGMWRGLMVFGYSHYSMGCLPFHSQSAGCSCLLWTCRRCGSTCHEHPRIKVDRFLPPPPPPSFKKLFYISCYNESYYYDVCMYVSSLYINIIRWFPTNERASAVGISMAGFHLGNVTGLLVTPVVISSLGISGPFFLFSSLGLLWLTLWESGAANDPREIHLISQSELRLIQAGKTESPARNHKFPSLRLLLSKLPTWAIIFANITNNWVCFPCFHHKQNSLLLIASLQQELDTWH